VARRCFTVISDRSQITGFRRMSDTEVIQSVANPYDVDVETCWNSRSLLSLGIFNHGFAFGASGANQFNRRRRNTRVLESLDVRGAYEQDRG
jgi:hypothetical protein